MMGYDVHFNFIHKISFYNRPLKSQTFWDILEVTDITGVLFIFSLSEGRNIAAVLYNKLLKSNYFRNIS